MSLPSGFIVVGIGMRVTIVTLRSRIIPRKFGRGSYGGNVRYCVGLVVNNFLYTNI
ncbi:uncharacterized protein METZ01_LOCUS35452 [marine metagenome]|uniref:Uncharacterized protein n=1 Tax=marine metagenome TaxID=408172 RepID=A0A381QVE7_9ZZZZ